MEEQGAAEEAGARVLAVDHAVEALQERRATNLERAEVLRAVRRHERLRARDAVARVRVRALPLGEPPAAGQRALALEHREHADHLARVVAVGQRVPKAELVGLGLVIAAVLEEEDAEPGARDLSVLRDGGRERRADTQAERRQLLAADLLDAVPRGHVSALVPEHGGELRLVGHVGQQAARDEDVAAGHRERVDRRVVDHVILPRELGALRARGERLPDRRHVRLERRVGHEAIRGDGVGGALAPHLDFLRLGDEGEFPPTAHGIGRAGAGGQNRPGQHERAAAGGACEVSHDADYATPRGRTMRRSRHGYRTAVLSPVGHWGGAVSGTRRLCGWTCS